MNSVETSVATAKSLAERICAGDRAAEGEFIARYYRRVLVMARIRLRDEHMAMRVALLTTAGVLGHLRDRGEAPQRALPSEVLGEARKIVRESGFRRRPPDEGLPEFPAGDGGPLSCHSRVRARGKGAPDPRCRPTGGSSHSRHDLGRGHGDDGDRGSPGHEARKGGTAKIEDGETPQESRATDDPSRVDGRRLTVDCGRVAMEGGYRAVPAREVDRG